MLEFHKTRDIMYPRERLTYNIESSNLQINFR